MSFEEAVKALYLWQHHYTGCFHDKLYDLFQKADERNKCRLTIGFPAEARALEEWNRAGEYGEALFKEWHLQEARATSAENGDPR